MGNTRKTKVYSRRSSPKKSSKDSRHRRNQSFVQVPHRVDTKSREHRSSKNVIYSQSGKKVTFLKEGSLNKNIRYRSSRLKNMVANRDIYVKLRDERSRVSET